MRKAFLIQTKALVFFTGFAISILINNVSWSQACCSGGVPISNNIGIRPVDKNIFSVRAFYDANVLNSFYTGTDKLEDGTIKRLSQTIFLQGIYGINKRISINTMLSYVHNKRSLVDSPEQSTTTNGIGDATFLMQYMFLDKKETSFYITIGPKIPIGKNDILDESGILLAPDLQPGSGSWDFIGGLSFLRNKFIRQSMSLTINATTKVNTYAERFNGNQQYKYGNEIQLIAGISDNYFIKDKLINPGLLFRYWVRVEDLADGFVFPNTGGSWVFMVPSVNLGLSPSFSAFTSFEIPIYRNLTGTQLSTSLRVSFGFQYQFTL